MIIGTADFVKEKMLQLAEAFSVDQIVVATFVDTAEQRAGSYQLLSEQFDLTGQAGMEVDGNRQSR
jgi:hypothetical protein